MAEDADEFFAGALRLGPAVIVGDYSFCESELCVAGVVSFSQEVLYFVFGDIGEELEVVGHYLVGDGHELAEHFVGGLVDADVVAEGLSHFLYAVGAEEDGEGEADLRLLSGVSLEVSADEEVVGLLCGAEFDVGFDHDGVVALHEAIDEFVEENWVCGFESFFEGVAFQCSVDGELGGEANGVEEGHFGEPLAVSDDLGERDVEDAGDLVYVVFCVGFGLLRGEAGAGFVPSGGVSDLGGGVAYYDDSFVSQLLELPELSYGDGVPEVDVGGGWVNAVLDAQGTAHLELFDELLLRNDVHNAALYEL